MASALPTCLPAPPQLKRWRDEEHLHERFPFCESRQVLTEQALRLITHDTQPEPRGVLPFCLDSISIVVPERLDHWLPKSLSVGTGG